MERPGGVVGIEPSDITRAVGRAADSSLKGAALLRRATWESRLLAEKSCDHPAVPPAFTGRQAHEGRALFLQLAPGHEGKWLDSRPPLTHSRRRLAPACLTRLAPHVTPSSPQFKVQPCPDGSAICAPPGTDFAALQPSRSVLDAVLTDADIAKARSMALSGQCTRTFKFGRRRGQWVINGETVCLVTASVGLRADSVLQAMAQQAMRISCFACLALHRQALPKGS